MKLPILVVKKRAGIPWRRYSAIGLGVSLLGVIFCALLSNALAAELDTHLTAHGSPRQVYRGRYRDADPMWSDNEHDTKLVDTEWADNPLPRPPIRMLTNPGQGMPHTFPHRHLLAIEDTDTSDASDTVVRFKRSVGRRNFKFEKVSSEFKPFDQDYQESMIMLSFPGFFFAISSVIFGLVFCCCRACDRCGGKQPRNEGYTGMQRNCPKIIIFLSFIVVCGMCALGYIGNFQVDAAMKKFFDIVVLAATQVASQGKKIVSTLERLEGESFTALQADAEKVESVTLSARKEFLTYNTVRLIFINVGLVGAFLACLAGMYGLLCGSGTCAYLVFIIGIPVLFVTWVSFAIHLPASIMLADLCPQIDQFVEGEDAQQHPAVSIWVSCFQNSSFGDTFNISQRGVERKIGDINTHAPAYFINLTVYYNQSETAYNQLETLDDQVVKMEEVMDDNIDAGKYPDDTFPEGIDPFGQHINDFRSYARNLRNIRKMESCETQRNAFNQVKLVLCLDMLTGADLVLGAQGMIGCVMFFAVWMGILGKKRFPPENKFRDYSAGLDLERANGPGDFIDGIQKDKGKNNGRAAGAAGAGAAGSGEKWGQKAPGPGGRDARSGKVGPVRKAPLPPVGATNFRAHADKSENEARRSRHDSPADKAMQPPRPRRK